MNVVDLGRRETMQLKRRVFLVQRSQQVFIPFDVEVGVQSALHQNSGAAEGNRLIDLLADFFQRANVSVRGARPAVERAEGTYDIADIRIVDVAVDYVSDNVVLVSPLANLVSRNADPGNIMRFEQRGAIFEGKPLALEGPVQNALNLTRHVLSLLISGAISKME